MKISGINKNFAFKGLTTGLISNEHLKHVISPSMEKLKEISKNADVFIATVPVNVAEGNDYSIYTYALQVKVSPLKKNKKSVPSNSRILALSYLYNVKSNDPECKEAFVEYLDNAVDAVTK